METIEVQTYRERPIRPRSVRELYDPAVGAWEGDRLVGFARAPGFWPGYWKSHGFRPAPEHVIMHRGEMEG